MIEWIAENGENLAKIATSTVGVFAIIASMTPNESDNKALDFLWKMLNAFGFNVGTAKNANG